MCAPLPPPATYTPNITAKAHPRVIRSQSPLAWKMVVGVAALPELFSAATAIATTPSPKQISTNVPKNSADNSPQRPCRPNRCRPAPCIGRYSSATAIPPKACPCDPRDPDIRHQCHLLAAISTPVWVTGQYPRLEGIVNNRVVSPLGMLDEAVRLACAETDSVDRTSLSGAAAAFRALRPAEPRRADRRVGPSQRDGVRHRPDTHISRFRRAGSRVGEVSDGRCPAPPRQQLPGRQRVARAGAQLVGLARGAHERERAPRHAP